MSVTAFRDYLICPYRFYLRHVLKLRPLDDTSGEMAANQFGDLIHIALEHFGKSASRHEDDPLRIERQLLEHLHQHVSKHYSQAASAAISVQVAQAERRLKHVAAAQARRIAEGWQIDRVEASVGPQQEAKIFVDGEAMHIRGRFDRIDVCVRDGKTHWAILDYKTHGIAPEKKHLRKTDKGMEWIDLQLPLYRLMIPYLGIDADPKHVSVGYFNIGEKDVETRVNEANFDADLWIQAEKVIHDCIRRIRQRDFRPSEERVQYDDYGMILQTGITSRGRGSAGIIGSINASSEL
jgi:ATP-dependent helicase/DNAse subunit B